MGVLTMHLPGAFKLPRSFPIELALPFRFGEDIASVARGLCAKPLILDVIWTVS